MAMFPDFPFGASQTLSIGSLSLNLDWWDFASEESSPIGYRRAKDPGQQSTSTESLYGAPILEGTWFEAKHIFEWQLQLPNEKLFLLEAICAEQQARIKARQANVAVRLRDERLVYLGRLPRIRGKIGQTISSPAAPAGFSFFWAQFDVLLEVSTDFWEHFLKNSEGHLHNVKLAARELNLVPVSEDI